MIREDIDHPNPPQVRRNFHGVYVYEPLINDIPQFRENEFKVKFVDDDFGNLACVVTRLNSDGTKTVTNVAKGDQAELIYKTLNKEEK